MKFFHKLFDEINKQEKSDIGFITVNIGISVIHSYIKGLKNTKLTDDEIAEKAYELVEKERSELAGRVNTAITNILDGMYDEKSTKKQ